MKIRTLGPLHWLFPLSRNVLHIDSYMSNSHFLQVFAHVAFSLRPILAAFILLYCFIFHYLVYLFLRFSIYCQSSTLKCKFYGERHLCPFYSSWYSKTLEKYLEHNRCSINICRMMLLQMILRHCSMQTGMFLIKYKISIFEQWTITKTNSFGREEWKIKSIIHIHSLGWETVT